MHTISVQLTTIILDEPELGLHPSAIVVLAELIHDASKRTQYQLDILIKS